MRRLPRQSQLLRSLFVCLGALTLSGPAWAGEPDQVAGEPDDPLVANGSPVASCAWPTAVAVTGGGGLCTGTLIHPELVVYAAHCGAGNKTIRFGENAFSGGQTAKVAFCMTNPEYGGVNDQGHDWAFCKLSEPVTDVPITPPVHGPCQTSILQLGQEVAVVGFGQTLGGQTGVKNWGLSELLVVNTDVNISVLGAQGTASVCPGDSGGPAYVRFPDGSWRAFGIASTVSGGCGGTGTHSLINGAIPWLEEMSGLNLTPCTLQNGDWAPGESCGGFFAAEPNQGSGAWSSWCPGTVVSGDDDVCGPAWNGFDPTLPPTVAITYPTHGETFPSGTTLDILIDAVKQANGPAIASIHLKINGSDVALDATDPYGFPNAVFSNPGIFTLVAVAEDWMGGMNESEPVTIGIDMEVPDEPMDTGGESGDGGGGESDGDGGDSADEVGTGPGLDDGGRSDDGGCAIGDRPSRGGDGWLLLGLGLGLGVGLSRRRRRA